MIVHVRVLGTFVVEVDGRAMGDDAWQSRRSRQLAAFLAIAPEGRATVEQVMDALWPELDPEAARANLHKAASLARRAMGSKDAIVFRGGSVGLWPGAQVHVDAVDFEGAARAALRSGDRAACATVAASYRGELLPEERYEEWALATRERLARLHLDLLRAAGEWTAVVELDPTDELAHRELMRAHLGSGRVHAAIRQFQRLQTILRRELGVEPSADTTDLYREILGAAASGFVRPGLSGREVELVRARAALRRAREGRPAAILVTGPAGIGKTRLCEELVDQAVAEGWLVLRAAGREPTATVPYAALTEAISAAMVQRPEAADALTADDRRLLARLEGAAVPDSPVTLHRQSVLHVVLRLAAGTGAPSGLLFLDDLQFADDATVEVAHVLATAPFPRGLLLVASLRENPQPAAKQLREALVASGVGVEIDLGPLRKTEIDRIVVDVSGRSPSSDELDLVWELSGGNPFLALELAASADAMAAGADGVRAAIAGRMRRLPAGAAAALRAVALVADEFTADELGALAALPGDEALDYLEAATSAGVVARVGTRYRFRHDLVREELVRDVPEAVVASAHAAASERLRDVGAPAARIAHHLIAAGQGEEALEWLRRAIDDAFAVGAQADVLTLAEQALSIVPRDAELLGCRAEALDAVGDPGAPAAYAVAMTLAPPARRGTLAVRRAKALVMAGDIPIALETLAAVDDVEPRAVAQLYVTRGLASWCMGHLDDAEEYGRLAKARAEETGDLRDFVDATMVLAMVAHQRGVWPQRASLDLLDTTLRPELAAVVIDAHLCVAESFLYGGTPYDEVIAFGQDLLDRAVRSGAARVEAFATTLIGEAYLLRGDTNSATGFLEAAAGMHRTVGVNCGEALSLQRLAEARLANGDQAGARAVLDEAFVAARGSPVATRHLLDRIHGTVIKAAPDSTTALAAVNEAAQSVRGPLETCPPCSVNLSIPATIACASAGELERAGSLLAASEQVIAAFYPQGAWQAALDEARGHVAHSSGETEVAAALFRQAAEAFERWEQPLDADRCRRKVSGRFVSYRP